MSAKIRRIGVLTSGGDAPGMNSAVRAVVRTAVGQGIECIGIRRGWSGLISSDFVQLDGNSVSRIINKGGTMLYTARSEEFMDHAGREKAIATCKLLGLDAIVAIGGVNAETMPRLADLDVDGAAVVSAIFAADDIAAATRELSRIMDDVLPREPRGAGREPWPGRVTAAIERGRPTCWETRTTTIW